MSNKNRKVFWDNQEKVLTALFEQILLLSNKGGSTFISICGAAATGKSTLASSLKTLIQSRGKSVCSIQLDSFMLDRTDRDKLNLSGYDPKAHYPERVLACITQLKLNKPITYKPYSHITGHYSNKPVTVKPSDFTILEGIHSFHSKFWNNIHCAIFIEGDKETLKELRFQADTTERKYKPIEAFKHSEPEYKNFEKFILPYRLKANIFLEVKSNWQYTLKKKTV